MKILIAEDDAISRRLLERMLEKWGHEVIIAQNGNEALAAMDSETPPTLAILDWMMPGKDGVEVCSQIRAQGREPYTYIIMLTAKSQSDDIIQALNRGADDYIIKPFHATELRARVQAGVRICELQRELVEARDKLHEQATRDDLTKSYNRKTIIDMLDRELARGIRTGASVTVLMIDLDHFKNVNDTYGHQAGDAVLRETADRIRGVTRPYDGFGRLGGEEFLCIAPNNGESDGLTLAERLCDALRSAPVAWEETAISITASIGVAVSGDDAEETSQNLIRKADEALYRAKAEGRDCVRSADVTCPQPGK